MTAGGPAGDADGLAHSLCAVLWAVRCAVLCSPWDDGKDDMNAAQRRMRAAFEFMRKLGVRHWTFHDRDIAPEGKDWTETCANLQAMTQLAAALMKQTGIQLLWGTANLFSAARYANGAATNPDAHVFAYAAAQVKRAMDATHALHGDGTPSTATPVVLRMCTCTRLTLLCCCAAVLLCAVLQDTCFGAVARGSHRC
jgi:hypothetical protein